MARAGTSLLEEADGDAKCSAYALANLAARSSMLIMCFGSRDKGDRGLARSRDIDKQLRQDEKRLSKEVKLLLLGRNDLAALSHK